jgi:hypothetical protein
MILGHLDDEQDFASLVMDAWSSSRSDADARETFERLSTRSLAAKSAYQNASDLDRTSVTASTEEYVFRSATGSGTPRWRCHEVGMSQVATAPVLLAVSTYLAVTLSAARS